MDFEGLIDLLGHSVHHPDVKETFEVLGFEELPVAEMQSYGLFKIPKVYNENVGVEIDFTTKLACQDLKSAFTQDKYELIVNSIRFWKLQLDTPYPFSLYLREDAKAVAKKLNAKPYRKDKANPSGFVHCYYKDNFEVIVYLDDDKRLESFWVMLQNQFAKKSARQMALIKEQQGRITTEHLEELRALTAELPTVAWMERMGQEEERQDGEAAEESPFTVQNIQTAKTVLKEFIHALETAAQSGKVSQIQAAVKKTVNTFNKLNPKNNYFIETLEREELVDFITKAVRPTGFMIENGADITEPWREW